MRIFELEDNRPTISVEALLIPEFKAIWNRDKSKTKEKAMSELSYVFFTTDYKSVYNTYPSEERLQTIAEDLFDDPTYEPDELINRAQVKYEELQQTPSMNFLKAAYKAAESLQNYFNKVDFGKMNEKGQPIYKVDVVSKALGDAKKILDTLSGLLEKVQKEQTLTTNIRGGGQAGAFEDPD